jgi:hypothetical protein
MGRALALAGALTMAAVAGAAHASPGFIALEGSDATALHMDPQYTPQLFKYLQGSSSLNVLVYNPAGAIDLSGISGGVGTTNVNSLSGVTLSDYSAIYIESAYGCCTADNTALNGYGSAVSAFIAGGGNLSIENYIGGDYDGVVPGGNAPAGAIEGYTALNGGVGGGPICTDGEVTTALGMAKGFTQPPVDGCWSHQAYELSYWGGLGYVDLIHSSPEYYFGDNTNNGSSFLALGGTLGSPRAPEPDTWALMIIGLMGVGAMLRALKRGGRLANA